MGVFGKIKDMFNVSEERYFDETEDMLTGEEEDDFGGNQGRRGGRRFEDEPEQQYPAREYSVNDSSNVVNMHKKKGDIVYSHSSSVYGSNVVFQKIDRFSDVGAVADLLNDGKIVILNLETCPDMESRRVLDFLYGVSYANDGVIKRVAGRAYVFTPHNVDFSGEMLDEIQSNGTFNPGNAFPGDFTFNNH